MVDYAKVAVGLLILTSACGELGGDVFLGSDPVPGTGGRNNLGGGFGGATGGVGTDRDGGALTEGSGGGPSDAASADGAPPDVDADADVPDAAVSDTGSPDTGSPDEPIGFQTQRINISETGEEANGETRPAVLSMDGRFAAFASNASNLTATDPDSTWDIFVRDRWLDTTELVSVSSAGDKGNAASGEVAISSDGQIVAFSSMASNLVAEDTNGVSDVFVRDRAAGTTERVSVGHQGRQLSGTSGAAVQISGDGRFVLFESRDTSLVEGDTNGLPDWFVFDRVEREVERVSVSSSGEQANAAASMASISDDGRFVVFSSLATNLAEGDHNQKSDVFLHDRKTAETRHISLTHDGASANGRSYAAHISGDGRFVGFCSEATNLLPDNPSLGSNLYVRDLEEGTLELVSVAFDGGVANGASGGIRLSRDGRRVAFDSYASNLVPNDTNHAPDAFVFDRRTKRTVIVSVSNDGAYGANFSNNVAFSGNGQAVAFLSLSENLVSSDQNLMADVFIRDLARPSFWR